MEDQAAANEAARQRTTAIGEYRAALMARRTQEAAVARQRALLAEEERKFAKSEEHLLALQSVGQTIGEVLSKLDEDRYIVKTSSGPRYVVGCRGKVRSRRSFPRGCGLE